MWGKLCLPLFWIKHFLNNIWHWKARLLSNFFDSVTCAAYNLHQFTLCGILGLNELFGKPFCGKLPNKKDPLFPNMKILNTQCTFLRWTMISTYNFHGSWHDSTTTSKWLPRWRINRNTQESAREGQAKKGNLTLSTLQCSTIWPIQSPSITYESTDSTLTFPPPSPWNFYHPPNLSKIAISC